MEALGIDWRSLTYQFINVAAFVFLVSRLLGKPLAKLLEERRAAAERTASQLLEAEVKLAGAEDEKRRIVEQAAAAGRVALESAVAEAGRLRAELKEEREAEAARLDERLRTDHAARSRKLQGELSGELAAIVAKATETALREAA